MRAYQLPNSSSPFLLRRSRKRNCEKTTLPDSSGRELEEDSLAEEEVDEEDGEDAHVVDLAGDMR